MDQGSGRKPAGIEHTLVQTGPQGTKTAGRLCRTGRPPCWRFGPFREDGLRAARDHQRQALRLSRDLYAGGKGDYLDVLTAQASSLSAETEYASHRAAMAKDAVSLVRALGGGWTGENMTQP